MATTPQDTVLYDVAVIGAGPAGLSAAARAAALDAAAGRPPTYVLLEAFDAHAKTIQRYQKGKHVMAEPGFLDLRSDLEFAAGTREAILGSWLQDIQSRGLNIRRRTEVTKIGGAKNDFVLQLNDGSRIRCRSVVLAIGLEGNPRKLGCPGEDLEGVQYQLDDPKEYSGEIILVVGAGDSAIENALALTHQNTVRMVVRGKEFSRAKEGNLNAVIKAVSDPQGRMAVSYGSTIKRVVHDAAAARPLRVTLETPAGEEEILCNRIIARLGAIPPRKFVEGAGLKFPSERPDAIPALSGHYESNVPGIYVIGSLAGYPLIKQAMNQGYDVVEFIRGNFIKPADYPLLQYQFRGLPFEREADDLLQRFQSLIPMFRELNALAFRELIVESDILVAHAPGPIRKEAERRIDELRRQLADAGRAPRMTRIIGEGDVIYGPGDFGTSFFTIVDGEVTLQQSEGAKVTTTLGRGEFFGEMSLLSGRPRLETAIAGANCILVETPRRTMLKLMSSNEEVRSGIDWIFVVRELQRHFVPFASFRDLRDISRRVTVRRFKAGEKIFGEGDPADSLFVLRSGNATLSRKSGTGSVLVAQLRGGQLLGEMALMGDGVRRETAVASVAAEAIEVQRKEFAELMQRSDARIEPLQRSTTSQLVDNARMQVKPEAGSLMEFLMAEGLGEATNVLVIDDALCVGCDNCEKACAETHGGISRLDREAGPSFAQVHIPISCRHCEQPHCMKDCPPNAIRRSPTGEVHIDDSCIGCGNCQNNCPYGVIRMSYAAPEKPGLLSWLLFGSGTGPGEEPDYHATTEAKQRGKKATKCDACLGVASGPACVTACPTGAAVRITPRQYVDLIEEHRR